MDRQTLSTFGDYVAIARRRKAVLLICCPLILLVALLVAYKLPAIYRSTGTIMLEASSIPEDLVRSTVGSYADEQIELVRRRVMTTDRLQQLVEEVDPYPDRNDLSNREKARLIAENTEIERVDPITLEPMLESTAFSIHYNNPSPELAASVANAIANLFLENSRERRTQNASRTVDFVREQVSLFERQLAEKEAELSEFKRQNAGLLPENQGTNQNLLDRAQRDLPSYDQRIRTTEQSLSQLRVQLSQTPPSLISTAGNWMTDLAELRAQLATARQRYTEEHPTIRRLQRQIETLTAQAAARGDVVPEPDNPTYLELEVQIDSATKELAALRSERRDLQGQIDEYTKRIAAAPEVERQYLELTRDYELAQARYRDSSQKLSEAQQAVALETEQRGERFTMIRAPFPTSTPYSPNRLGIILLGIVLAFGGAVGLAAIVEASDSTIRGARDLRDVLGTPPLGAVPAILNRGDRRMQKLRWVAAVGAFAVIALVGISI